MDIVTIGEVLIDLTQTGKDERGIPQFAANPGGAPANLAVAAARLGAQTAFIGKVGADAFGRYLKEVLAENKVDVSGMAVDADYPTTIAVVSVDATGERNFSFYRSANADVMLSKEDISEGALKAAKIVHFGSVSLTADPSRTATLDAAARAKKLGAVITYDPNYRANLWKNKEDAIAQMKAPLPLVDILKVSDEELPLLTGTTDCESGTAQLAQNGIRLIFVTLGANGVFYRFGDKTGHVAGVPCKVGDTNGAGDTFFGAALSKLCKEELDTLTVDKLESILAFAVMTMFTQWGRFPAWALMIVLTREFAVTGLRLVAAPKGRVIAAAWSGKVKTASTMVGIIAWLLFPTNTVVGLVVSIVIVVTTVYSGVEYFVKNWSCLWD